MKMNTPQLVADLPQEFLYFMQHLQTLRYADRPNYAFLHGLLSDLFHKLGGDENTPFDWERERISGPRRPRPIPNLVDLCFLKVVGNIEKYKTIQLESKLQKRLLEFLIRVNNGKWNGNIMDKVLHSSMEELNLENCEVEDQITGGNTTTTTTPTTTKGGDGGSGITSHLHIHHHHSSTSNLNSINNYSKILSTCKSLKILKIGKTNDLLMKEIISSNSESLEILSLEGTKQLTSKGFKLLSEQCNKLKSLTIKNSEKLSDKWLDTILKNCTNLTSLNVSGCKKIKGSAFKSFTSKKRNLNLLKLDLSSCELNRRGFKYLTKVCGELEELTFGPLVAAFKITSDDFLQLLQSCSKLKSLELANYQFEMDTILSEIARDCTQLETLLLDGLSMTDYGLQNVVLHCTQLQTLRFRYGDGVTDSSLTQIARHCTLDSLTLDFWNKFNRLSVSDQGIKSLLQSCGNLKELSLCSCLILTGACFPETVYFPSLSLLNLTDCIQLNDFAIRRITESCPNLKSLSLSNLNNLSHAALEAIALGCPQLEELNLEHCTCFTDEPMIDLLVDMPKLFMIVTRFIDPELKGIQKEVHCSNVNRIFAEFPNTYRERAFDKTRRRMYGMGP